MRYSAAAAFLCIAIAASAMAKPPSSGGSSGTATTPNPQVAYSVASGKSYKLVVANEDGTNASTLYTSSSPIRFDLAPRGQHQIAISVASTTDPAIVLLSYGVTGTGSFAATGSTRIASARRGTNVDFSPDGTKIAFACCSNGQTEQLVVYDLATNSTAVWATDTFFWDVAWFRNGGSIAYSAPNADGTSGDKLYEVAGQGATPQVLLTNVSEIDFDASRTNPDALVVNHGDSAGNSVTGLYQAPTAGDPSGHFIDPNMTNSTGSNFSELNCSDSELAYLGPPNKTPTWYIRDLNTGTTHLFSRTYYKWLQFWPTCS